MCFTAASLPTPPFMFFSPLISLSFDEEGVISIQVSSLRDRSSSLMKVVLNVHVSKDGMMLQPTSLFRATFQSSCKHLMRRYHVDPFRR